MGYLDNSSITVDAVLTKKGREILKNGGNLNINSFTLSDTGVDYRLWNPDHPSGSSYYGEAIENLPMLEASVHAEFNLRNRLISLNQTAVAVPTIVLTGLDSKGSETLTFSEGDEQARGQIGVQLLGLGNDNNLNTVNSIGSAYQFVIQDPTIVSTNATLIGGVSGTSGQQFVQEQDIANAQLFGFSGDGFSIKPRQQDSIGKQTNITVIHVASGAYRSFVVVNNIIRNVKDLVPEEARIN